MNNFTPENDNKKVEVSVEKFDWTNVEMNENEFFNKDKYKNIDLILASGMCVCLNSILMSLFLLGNNFNVFQN